MVLCLMIFLQTMVEEGEELFHEHEYHRNMDYRQDPVYVNYFNSYKDKYEMNL